MGNGSGTTTRSSEVAFENWIRSVGDEDHQRLLYGMLFSASDCISPKFDDRTDAIPALNVSFVSRHSGKFAVERQVLSFSMSRVTCNWSGQNNMNMDVHVERDGYNDEWEVVRVIVGGIRGTVGPLMLFLSDITQFSVPQFPRLTTNA